MYSRQLIEQPMPSINVTNELDQLVKLITKHPQGISLDSITKTVDSVSKRTLQRRLATPVYFARLVLRI